MSNADNVDMTDAAGTTNLPMAAKPDKKKDAVVACGSADDEKKMERWTSSR